MVESADAFWGHPDNHLQPGEELAIRDPKTKQVLGIVRRTLGGFYRAYSYMSGSGWGPFLAEKDAHDWVWKHAKPIPGYSRRLILDEDGGT